MSRARAASAGVASAGAALAALGVAALGVAALGAVAAAACARDAPVAAANRQVYGGDAARGHALVASGAHGCAACHAIPGVRAPRGVVGPPLDGMAARSFIAGQLPNTPDVLVAFLRNPPALVPQTGMPDTRLSAAEARDVAAYLYTLEAPDAR